MVQMTGVLPGVQRQTKSSGQITTRRVPAGWSPKKMVV